MGTRWNKELRVSTRTRLRRDPIRPSPRRPRTRRATWVALLAALAVASGGAWFYLRQRAEETVVEVEAIAPEERALRDAARHHPADTEAQRALGSYLLEQHRPYAAIWSFQNALELRPADAEACRGLARALIVAQLPQYALPVLASCSASSSPIQNPNAEHSAKSGATPEIQNPKSKIQNDVENRRVAATAYLAMGDAVGAVALLETAGPALDRSAPALLDLGNAAEALGDDARAARAYEQHLRLQPDSVEGNLALGRVAARQRRWSVAFAALARARRAAPDDPRPLYQFGLARLAQGGAAAESEKPGGAIWLFRRVLQSHPGYGPALLQVGLWLMRHGQPGAAALSLERAVAAQAGGDETRLLLAAALEAAGRKLEAAHHRGLYFEATQQPDRALREYQRMATLEPARKDVPLLLSAVYTHREMKAQAAEAARRGLEQHPEDPQLLARRAMLLMMTDDRAGATRLCRAWLERQPDAAEPYYLLGRMEREALRPAEAVRLMELAMARDPQNASYCLETALALNAAPTPANQRRATALLRRAIALNPHAPDPHLRLGELLERQDDPDGALQEYQRSADEDPTARYGIYSLSQLCPRLGKGGRAAFYAEIVRLLREREDVVRPLERRVYRAPGDVEAHARLSGLLLESGDLQQARYQLEQTVALRPDRQKEKRRLEVIKRLLALREQ
jgi:cytochrome c-type biogenesis protein CcmH/NrfG